MERMQFKLPIGAKRQVTLPRAFMEALSLEESGELLLEVVGDHAMLTPIVSIPRTALPEELRLRFEARRGKKDSDVPLVEFLADLRGEAKAVARPATRGVQKAVEAQGLQEPAGDRKVQQREEAR